MTFHQKIVPCCDINGHVVENYVTMPTREYDLSVHGLGEMSDLSSVSENNQKQLLSQFNIGNFLEIKTLEEKEREKE